MLLLLPQDVLCYILSFLGPSRGALRATCRAMLHARWLTQPVRFKAKYDQVAQKYIEHFNLSPYARSVIFPIAAPFDVLKTFTGLTSLRFYAKYEGGQLAPPNYSESLFFLTRLRRLILDPSTMVEDYKPRRIAEPFLTSLLPYLEELRIWDDVECNAMDTIVCFTRLTSLKLNGRYLDAAGLAKFSQLTGLTKLVLKSTSALPVLLEALRALPALRSLRISTSMAATQRQWIFTGLTALRHLQVHDNHNIRTELEQLQLPAQLSTLDLRVTTGSAMIGPSLRSFNLTQYYNPNLPFLAMVCKLPLLKFSIGDMNMSRVLPMLTALTTLTALRLANTNISSTRNLTCLLVLTRLISLQLDISTGPFFEHLSALTNLRMLTFTQEGVGQKSTRPDIPIDALPRLPSLYLLSIRSEGHNAWRFDVSSLTNVTSIRMLELHEHFLDPPDLTPLTSLRNLHFLRLRESSPPPCGLEVSVLPLLAPLSGLSWVMLSGFSEEITKAAEARYPATKFWSVPQFRFSG